MALHKVKAYLYDNALTDDPNDLVARVQSERSLSVKDICQTAATRGGADISAEAMEHAVNLWFKEMGYSLCDGFSVNTGWFSANASIKGVFNSPNEHFNSTKHTLLFDFVQGSLLRKEITNVEIEILGVADNNLSVAQVTDVRTGSVNDLLTANCNLRIIGNKMKIVGDNPANGIYIVNTETKARIKINEPDIVVNNPSEIIVLLPAIAPGTYKVEVVTQYSANKRQPLNEPRTAVLDKILTVL